MCAHTSPCRNCHANKTIMLGLGDMWTLDTQLLHRKASLPLHWSGRCRYWIGPGAWRSCNTKWFHTFWSEAFRCNSWLSPSPRGHVILTLASGHLMWTLASGQRWGLTYNFEILNRLMHVCSYQSYAEIATQIKQLCVLFVLLRHIFALASLQLTCCIKTKSAAGYS